MLFRSIRRKGMTNWQVRTSMISKYARVSSDDWREEDQTQARAALIDEAHLEVQGTVRLKRVRAVTFLV
jgi:hypothetical protein